MCPARRGPARCPALPHFGHAVGSVRDTVICLAFPAVPHRDSVSPPELAREMHQSRMERSQFDVRVLPPLRVEAKLPVSHAARAFSASGAIFTNHWSERYGSITVLQR